MAVVAQLWTIGGLSTELALNPATVGKIVAKLKPDGVIKGRNAYLMANVVKAMQRRSAKNEQTNGKLIDARTRQAMAGAAALERQQGIAEGKLLPFEGLCEALEGWPITSSADCWRYQPQPHPACLEPASSKP